MLANCLDPQTIEDAQNSLNELESLFQVSFPGPLRETVAKDILTLKSFIEIVKAAQPTNSELEAAFVFGG